MIAQNTYIILIGRVDPTSALQMETNLHTWIPILTFTSSITCKIVARHFICGITTIVLELPRMMQQTRCTIQIGRLQLTFVKQMGIIRSIWPTIRITGCLPHCNNAANDTSGGITMNVWGMNRPVLMLRMQSITWFGELQESVSKTVMWELGRIVVDELTFGISCLIVDRFVVMKWIGGMPSVINSSRIST